MKLPSSYNSRDATDATKKIVHHDDAEFATNMLHAMPKTWKQHLGHKAPPNVEYLQDALEKIEVAFPVDGSRMLWNNGHQKKMMTAMTDRIPKKKSQNSVKFSLGNSRSDRLIKSCTYCKKYGGAHNTHNTNECKKWDQNGTLKKTFKSKARSNSETPPGVGKSYAQLYAENKKLKANQKKSKRALKKAHKNKKKRKYESDSDSTYDSDSS